MKARFIVPLVALGALFASAAANAETGYTVNRFHIFAGPGRDYPRLETVPEDARVHIFGCMETRDWCDVAWNGVRGWIDSNGLEVVDRGRRIRASDLDLPIISFSVDGYWRDHYRDRHFYRDRDRWYRDRD
jgi:uncharacterized protein YraI